MDSMDDDIFKPKKKSATSQGAASATAKPASKTDSTPSKMAPTATKPKGHLKILT